MNKPVSEIFKRTFSEQEGCTERQFAHHIFFTIVYYSLFFLPSRNLLRWVTSLKVFFLPFLLHTYVRIPWKEDRFRNPLQTLSIHSTSGRKTDVGIPNIENNVFMNVL